MFRKLTAVFLSLLMVAAFVPVPALAQGDTTPPVLVSFAINATDFNVGDNLAVTIVATDDSSGIDLAPNRALVGFKRKDTDSNVTWFEIKKDTEAGNDDTYIAQGVIDKDVWASGQYYIASILLMDEQENVITYSIENNNLKMVEFNVTNNVRTDWTGPVMSDLTLSSSSANVGDTITFTITATDPAGLGTGYICIGSAFNAYQTNFQLTVDSANPNVLHGSLTVPDNMPDGKYWMRSVAIADTLGNYSCYEEGTSLPAELDQTFTINNPQYKPSNGVCKLQSISISPQNAKQGDPVTITVKLDPNGNELANICFVRIGLSAWGRDSLSTIDFGLDKVSDGVYSRPWILPVNWSTGEYMISDMDITDSTGVHSMQIEKPAEYLEDSWKLKEQKFFIDSIYTGTANTSIALGSSFDPLAGVSAGNTTEGDLTSKIVATGTVDTSKVGVYLITYKIKSQNKPLSGEICDLYYYDFRWVGVTEVAPDPSAGSGTLVVTDGAVKVGAAKSDVTLTRDGKSVAYAASMASAGNYIASVKGQSGSDKAGFIIDNAGPAVTATYSIASPTKINVTACSKDPSGVVQTKWKAGTAKLADIRAKGTVFNKTFTVGSFGVYTIYAKDKLGHESIKTITVKSIAVASIGLNQKSAKLAVGAKLQLSAKVAPTNATFKTLTWSSSNTKVATVDASGKVKAVGAGTATITAKAPSGKTAQCKVVVHTVAVTQVTLNKRTTTLGVKSSVQLTAKVTPTNASDQKVKWTSSNKKVATVDSNGKVVAVGKGTVFIYAKAANGLYARCKITVK
jgi:uncharacterized protein YjdB